MLPKSNMIFIGLDGEMTSTDVGHGQLCQIGVALNHAKWFVSDIRIASYAECNPISMAVHGIPEKYLKRSAPLRGEVDDNLYGFLQAIGGNTEKKIYWQ